LSHGSNRTTLHAGKAPTVRRIRHYSWVGASSLSHLRIITSPSWQSSLSSRLAFSTAANDQPSNSPKPDMADIHANRLRQLLENEAFQNSDQYHYAKSRIGRVLKHYDENYKNKTHEEKQKKKEDDEDDEYTETMEEKLLRLVCTWEYGEENLLEQAVTRTDLVNQIDFSDSIHTPKRNDQNIDDEGAQSHVDIFERDVWTGAVIGYRHPQPPFAFKDLTVPEKDAYVAASQLRDGFAMPDIHAGMGEDEKEVDDDESGHWMQREPDFEMAVLNSFMNLALQSFHVALEAAKLEDQETGEKPTHFAGIPASEIKFQSQHSLPLLAPHTREFVDIHHVLLRSEGKKSLKWLLKQSGKSFQHQNQQTMKPMSPPDLERLARLYVQTKTRKKDDETMVDHKIAAAKMSLHYVKRLVSFHRSEEEECAHWHQQEPKETEEWVQELMHRKNWIDDMGKATPKTAETKVA